MVYGYLKLYRELQYWQWYKTKNMVQFWVHCLIRANHAAGEWNAEKLQPGQFISGRKALSEQTGLSEREIRTCIKNLKNSQNMTSRATSRYSVFTIENWEKWQVLGGFENEATNKTTSKRPASDQQATTNKNKKNKKNENIDIRKQNFKDSLNEHISEYGASVVNDFFAHWSEADYETNLEMRFEGEKYFSAKKRLDNWINNSFSPIHLKPPTSGYSDSLDLTIDEKNEKRSVINKEALERVDRMEALKLKDKAVKYG